MACIVFQKSNGRCLTKGSDYRLAEIAGEGVTWIFCARSIFLSQSPYISRRLISLGRPILTIFARTDETCPFREDETSIFSDNRFFPILNFAKHRKSKGERICRFAFTVALQKSVDIYYIYIYIFDNPLIPLEVQSYFVFFVVAI